MSTEPITGLTYQEAGSRQTDAVQNAELNFIGAWLNCVVLSVGDNDPPGSPAEGDCYIVGTSATGAWATHDNALAVYRDGWQFYTPKEGVSVKDLDSGDDYEFIAAAWTVKAGGGGASTSQTDECISGLIVTPSDGEYKIVVNAPHGGTITEVTTISDSGTCTLTVKVNTTALGGTANSVSSSEQSQAHSSTNTFAAGDDIVLAVSSNSSCSKMTFTIKYTRTLA